MNKLRTPWAPRRLFLQMAQELGITVNSLKDDDLMDKVSYASLVLVELIVRS